MFLEKLEIQGFKSFAGKNALTFPEKGSNQKKGITAVVGPNGSGKSNIADAIRWTLGEQSMKNLRARSNEDVIFSGSSTKGRVGMSEVSLYLNNEDKQAPVDYSELVITRRLYRNGENEYLVNNKKTKLSDIQMLLAKANFGQKTYSVIGQGMVEEFLKTSPAERKNFFDEATGVKQYQLKRERSLNKLLNSKDNLKQAEMLLQEVEPRLKTLTKQVNKLRQKEELQKELKQLQDKYYRTKWHTLHDQFSKYNERFLELEKEKKKKTDQLEQYNQELNQIEQEDQHKEEVKNKEQELSKLRQQREDIVKQIATLNAQLEVNLDSQGKFDLSWLYSRQEELKKQTKDTEQELESLDPQIKEYESRLSEIYSAKEETDKNINKLNEELFGLASPSQHKEKDQNKEIKEKLEEIKSRIDKLKGLKDINKIQEFLSHIEEILEEATELTSKKREKEDQHIKKKKDEIKKKLKEKEESRRENEKKKDEITAELNSIKQRKEFLNKSIEGQKKELKGIEDKLSRHQQGKEQEETLRKKEELDKKLEEIDKHISSLREELKKYEHTREEQNKRIFSLQKETQRLQSEINQLNNELGETKTSSTKYETRLEELEEEIREELNNVKNIKDERCTEEIDPDKTKQKIDKIKNQLNQIGSIDPEVENEYEKTKKKYDFLSEQTKDLKEGISNLKTVIQDLDKTIKQKFDEEFQIISKKFEEYFKTLFGGGSAKIIKLHQKDSEENKQENKQEKEDLGDIVQSNSTGLAGIDIQATPPGKKINSLSVLSGGEKALTSIALICAIISANPSPFVVLDEVDAALDEANSQKFAQILDELAHKTQFILITHNRASMYKSDVLYGTTMDEHGITKLLSLKLEEAKKKTV